MKKDCSICLYKEGSCEKGVIKFSEETKANVLKVKVKEQ